ncbi:hypothetical protein [Glycomyces arizonensis]|nr:hypothetical protein [Glycomyces arizonensis]
MIVGAHRHVWDTRLLAYAWSESETGLPRVHLPHGAADEKQLLSGVR